jgi:signal transduction histidine kinase
MIGKNKVSPNPGDEQAKVIIANTSHELRTPISVISLIIENLKDGITKPSPAIFEQLENETRKLSNRVNFMLNIANVESGNVELSKDKVDLYELFSEIAKSLYYINPEKSIEFQIGTVPEKLKITTDKNLLEQIIENLLTNAIKHSKTNSKVYIQAYKEKRTVIIKVINEGNTVSKTETSKVFDRFYSKDSVNSEGTGLGLSIVKWGVDLLSGEVTIENNELGTAFIVKLKL